MNISTIEHGEELLRKASKNWKEVRLESGNSAIYCLLDGRGGEEYSLTAGVNGHEIPRNDAEFIVWMHNHASELLQMAREVEELKKKVENLQWHYNDMQSRNPDA